jgi:hypothetical protein
MRQRDAGDRQLRLPELKKNTSERKVLARENCVQEKNVSKRKVQVREKFRQEKHSDERKEMLAEGRSPKNGLVAVGIASPPWKAHADSERCSRHFGKQFGSNSTA